MKRAGVMFSAIAIIVLLVLFFSPTPSEHVENPQHSNNNENPPLASLDYSKPIFTRDGTLVCPTDLLLDPDEHDWPFGITNYSNDDGKARDAGCMAWRANVRVFVRPLTEFKGLVNIGLTPDVIPDGWFTTDSQLTNNLPEAASSDTSTIDKDQKPTSIAPDQEPRDKTGIQRSANQREQSPPPEQAQPNKGQLLTNELEKDSEVGFPSCVYCPKPPYTENARAAKIQGTVQLRVIIETDGHARNIEVVNGLGYGLDETAVETVQTWRFRPANRADGTPIATVTPIEINYRLP